MRDGKTGGLQRVAVLKEPCHKMHSLWPTSRHASGKRGFTGEVFAAVSQELPEWTRERWEKAVHELSAARTRAKDHGALRRIDDFHIPSNLVVMSRAFHDGLEISMRYPHCVS